jgi:hypothetical protein
MLIVMTRREDFRLVGCVLSTIISTEISQTMSVVHSRFSSKEQSLVIRRSASRLFVVKSTTIMTFRKRCLLMRPILYLMLLGVGAVSLEKRLEYSSKREL